MDTPVRVTSTEEDEIIDIEGDIDDVTIQNDVTIKNREVHCDENYTAESDNKIPVSQAPFMRQKICKTPKNRDSASENEFTKWWKSASEFQRPVTPISKKDYDIITESAKTTSELDPILQQPVKEDKEISSDELDLTHYDEDGELFHPPKEEISFSINELSEQEREKFPEFFSGRTKYSPHNYITIRNTILKLWEEKRPEHVNKVMLRPILKKGCGNVNNVGRIHRYLESIGAINFGSDAVWWKRKRRKLHVYRPPRTALDTDFKLKRALEQRMSGRSRKRPAPMTTDPSSNDTVGGYTIDHANNNALVIPKTKEKKESSIKLISSKKFNLVKCKEYAPAEECPYEVTIHSSALVIMDVHSHLSTNEVMGLIGGHVTKYGDKVKVQITCAQPCKSSGSKKHCEMDPVSQSFACEQMMQKGLKVVGWYHSHPTFLPQPSEMDIATQLEQQSVFSSHGSVFLGVILSPYYKHQIKTQVNLVHMDPFMTNGITSGHPFSISYEIDSQPLDGDMETELLTALSEIIENSIQEAGNGKTSSRLSHLLDPVVQGSSITHLDKLTKSLSSFVTSQPNTTVMSQSIDTSESHTTVMSQSIDTSQSDSTVMSQSIDTSQSDTAHFAKELDAAFDSGMPIISSQDIMTSAYEIVTSQDVLTSPYDDIVTSQMENEDIVSSILEGDAFSIDQNFPSLAGDGFCQTDNLLSHNDVKGTDDVISADDVIELPQDEDIEESRRLHPSWNDVFDKLKFLLLRASEKVLN